MSRVLVCSKVLPITGQIYKVGDTIWLTESVGVIAAVSNTQIGLVSPLIVSDVLRSLHGGLEGRANWA